MTEAFGLACALIHTGFEADGFKRKMDISGFHGLRFETIVSAHSYSLCWIHLIWGTLDREKLLNKTAAARVSKYLDNYAEDKGIYMKINYVNADHVHALIDLPTAFPIEELMQLLKGSSSHWINVKDIMTGKFAWWQRLWGVLCLRIERGSGRTIYCTSGRTSSHAPVRRGIARVHRPSRATVEGGGKPLKRLWSGRCLITGLKAGVNERNIRSCRH